jgi:hypothetical protein
MTATDRAPAAQVCECDHLDVLHAIRRDKTRGACSVSIGHRATPCGCRSYTPRKEEA